MTRRLEIGEQDFDVVESFTVEQELYLAGLIRRARIDRLNIRKTDSADTVFFAFADALEKSRIVRRMLSVLLVPAGEPWTMEQSRETEVLLRECLPAADDNIMVLVGTVLFEALIDRGALTASMEAATPAKRGR